MKYLIKLSYDGSNFSGFQKQPKLRNVQEEIEKAVTYINNHKTTKIVGAGRTDKGVHAIDQAASFELNVDITLYKLKCALNSLTPEDIHINSVRKVKENFHARYMVKEKTYKYLLNMGEYNPLQRNYVYQYGKKLDIEKMNESMQYFLGEHDFKNFVSNEAKLDNYVRVISKVALKKSKNIIEFKFTGTGFMKYQVRNMVGTLIKVGSGKLDPNIIKDILNDKEKAKYVYTAKPEGLYLIKVKY